MGRKRAALLVLLLAGLMLACSVSIRDDAQDMTQAEMDAAIEQTMAARQALSATANLPLPPTAPPTTTPLPPTAIHTVPPTAVPTFTATQDLRVILVDASLFQLVTEDLPWQGNYTIPNEKWYGPYTNDELIAAWEDPVQARQYLEESGRITGFETYFQRGNASAPLPEQAGCSVVQFRTAEGAQRSITEYTLASHKLDENWVSAEVILALGDVSSAEYLETVDSGGNLNLKYWVSTSYRNMVVECVGYGAKANITPAFVEEMTQKVLAKVKAAPLSEPAQSLPSTTTGLQLIMADPSNFQPKPEDLPWRGEYTVPGADWAGPNTNDQIMITWDDAVLAREYLAETGRVTGYITYYQRGNTSAPLPQELGCAAAQYLTAEGAQKSITVYTAKLRSSDKGWVSADVTQELGDVSSAYYLEELDSGGNTTIQYWVSTTHLNYMVECFGWGAKAYVTSELVEDLVQKVLAKVQAAPVNEP